MSCKDRLEGYLRQHRIAYQLQHHPVAYTSQEVANTMHLSNQLMVKVVMVVADNQLVMLVLPASASVSILEVSETIGAKKVYLSQEADFREVFSDCEVGAMPPFGNLYNLPVYVDQSLSDKELIYFQAGSHTDTICIRYADFERLVKPIVGHLRLTENPAQRIRNI